jgi:hypothetical protein
MNIHKHARLMPKSRAELLRRMSAGQSPVAVAGVLGVSGKTAAKWFRRLPRQVRPLAETVRHFVKNAGP